MNFTISLIGRPNVGKSTLLNRLAGKRKSLVHDEPGLTRDRIHSEASFDDREFLLIDTGGLELDSKTDLMKSIKRQAEIAIESSDIIFFMVDAKAGLLPGDREIAQKLRQSKRPVYLVINKTEARISQEGSLEFFELGFDKVFSISGAHGQGLAALFEAVWEQYPSPPLEEGDGGDLDDNLITLSIVGKPNAGKSSYINKLLGEERLLVSEVPGTTVDAVDSKISYGDYEYKLIDTAGIRRKRSIYKESEKMAVSASLCALDRSEVAIMMIDATEGLTEQDLKIASFIDKKSKGVVLVINKWDLAKSKDLKAEAFLEHIRYKMPFLEHAPAKFISAKTGSRIFDVLDVVADVYKNYHQRITTAQVNKLVESATSAHQPPMVKGRRLKFFFSTQVSVAPPTFLFTVNDNSDIHFSYKRYLSNQIRKAFGFRGAPVRMVFRERSSKET